MVMKVVNLSPINFKATQTLSVPINAQPQQYKEIKELSNITPDYSVNLPQKFTKTGVVELKNGLKLHTYKLANGHKITIVPMENSPTTVKNYVNVGALNETDDIKGISHFLEHMAFNGTLGTAGYEKLNQGDSFSKIEKLGGWTNASTSHAVTNYVNSTPLLDDADLETQIKVIASMTEDLALTDEMIEKEKGPVCSEINMIMDSPQTILFDQTVRSLFNIKSSADDLVGGSVEHIKNLNRQKVKDYYDTHYTPDNMNLVITGDVDPDKAIELVAKSFKSKKTKPTSVYEEKLVPINKTIRKDFITDKAESAQIMLGFAGPKRNNSKEIALLGVVNEYLISNSAGIEKELRKFNTYPEMGADKISTNPNIPMFLFYAMDCAEENSEKVLKTFLTQLNSVSKISNEDLDLLKERLIQSHQDDLEYSNVVNGIIGSSILDNNLDYVQNYEDIISSITVDDVDNFIKKYFDINKTAITVVHPQTTEENILNNYNEANQISFRGSNRMPVNMEKVETVDLKNNYKVALQETQNENFNINLNLRFNPLNKNINPAAAEILGYIYDYGTKDIDEDEYINYKEKNNLSTSVILSSRNLLACGYSSLENAEKSINLINEIITNPRITQEEFDKAVDRINDSLNRSQDSAESLFVENEALSNELYITKNRIREGLKTVTLEDVQNLHDYIKNSSTGAITLNIPQKHPEFKEQVLDLLNNLDSVKEFNLENLDIYSPNLEPKIISKAKEVSQADIMQTYKYEKDGSVKEKAVEKIMNSILSSSQTIGLFNTLREKEHLAYSVYSEINSRENCGILSCNILTTTDNKDIGEISYDNVQKSIDGFHRQINALLNSEYSDEDLENAKRKLKANLLNKEGVDSKLIALMGGIYSKSGIEYQNKVFEIIDSITRDDIQIFAQKVFENPPIYTIVASQDTLDANKEYFEKLKQA